MEANGLSERMILKKILKANFAGKTNAIMYTEGQSNSKSGIILWVRTDTVLESSHGNMSAHKKFQLKAQN